MTTAKPQQGVMLIEALIGILIFSIGILALIGMQGTAIKNTTDARYRSEAAFLANQVIGQMWVDFPSLALYDHDDTTNYGPRNNWRTTVQTRLPGVDIANNVLVPQIQVGPDAGLGLAQNEVRVIIQWQQPGETTARNFRMLNRVNPAVTTP
jgi:type IV pilus assembly protein PilV